MARLIKNTQKTTLGFRLTTVMEDSAAALDAALDTDCDLVLICGSLYLAADLRGRFPCDDRLFDVK